MCGSVAPGNYRYILDHIHDFHSVSAYFHPQRNLFCVHECRVNLYRHAHAELSSYH